MESTKQYEDMHGFVDTCKKWLLMLIVMAPDATQSLKQDSFLIDEANTNPADLSPKSKELRAKAGNEKGLLNCHTFI